MLEGRQFGVGVHAAADWTIALELAMGIGLLLGAALARAEKFKLHAWCQSFIVVLNLVLIFLLMAASFRTQVLSRIPEKLNKFYYAIATLHAALGTVAEFLGLYIVVAAGTKILPERLRLRRYKFWMRSLLALWWIVLLVGAVTYARWHWPQIFKG